MSKSRKQYLLTHDKTHCLRIAMRFLVVILVVVFVVFNLRGCVVDIGEDALVGAAAKGDPLTIERLTNLGVNINCVQHDLRFTPLMFASANGNTTTVAAILRHHPNLNYQDFEGRTALRLAIKSNHLDIVRLLREAGATE